MKNLDFVCKAVKQICEAEGVDYIFLTEDGRAKCDISGDESLRTIWGKIKNII